MKNEDSTSNEFIHLLIALRRNKDNEDLPERCLRHIIYGTDDEAVAEMEARLHSQEGTWRIHKTINKRSTHKAMQLLQHKMIDNPTATAERLYSEWKTCLMRRESKAERNILLDIDSTKAYLKVMPILTENKVKIKEYVKTPNGRHIVVNALDMDTRLVDNIPDVTFQRDGYIYIKTVLGGYR